MVQDNSKMLVCNECKLSVHFLCSGLPGSQIYLYLGKKGYRRYVCDGCVGDIPTEYQVDNDQVKQLEDRVIKLERELKVYKELYEKGLIQKRKMEMDNSSLVERLNSGIFEERDRIEQSTQVELPIHADLEEMLEKIVDEKLSSTVDKINESISSKLTQHIELVEKKQLETFYNSLEENVTKKVDDINTRVTELITTNKTYAQTLKNFENGGNNVQIDFRRAVKDDRNMLLLQEKERDRRVTNFIVHGLEEKGDTIEAKKDNDDASIKLFLERIGVEAQPTSMTRLGKPEVNKKRPLKIVMSSRNEKALVMANLQKLKGSEDQLGKLSVRDDYTIEERAEIKAWVDKAKAANEENDNNELFWAVRGTPKNGMRLVKLTRRPTNK